MSRIGKKQKNETAGTKLTAKVRVDGILSVCAATWAINLISLFSRFFFDQSNITILPQLLVISDKPKAGIL